ncbi:hypothetical protein ACGIF2_14695 [Cellulomonas sp. P22]|uniref:hypothetical protein n=1 Tax=Cellulomonas sp. P22 TaxID=3373189 RepID=UPI0037B388CC
MSDPAPSPGAHVPKDPSPADDLAPVGSVEPADIVEAAVLAVPGVARLSGGAATYLPGRRVAGVRLDPGRTEVHVVVTLDRPVPDVADAVRAAVQQVRPAPVDVHVDDLEVPDT